MAGPSPKLVFSVFLVINVILVTQNLHPADHSSTQAAKGSLPKRLYKELLDGAEAPSECSPIQFPVNSQCSHVLDECPQSDTFVGVQYAASYFCSQPSLRPLAFIGLLVWLLFLFSTLGISASDFFTPNLGTIASLLGMDESVAGVTFLAFGNGSPDVFSTFSAMRANSGSLAIGELVGAASFIVSCVVGSMCIVKPFPVNRKPFLRDVGFFTVAISFLFIILWDGKVTLWEAVALLTLYVGYVITVVVGSWWDRRMERIQRRDDLVRSEYQDDTPSNTLTPYRDNPNAPNLHLEIPFQPRPRAFSNPPPLSPPVSLRPRAMSNSLHLDPQHVSTLPSFSFVGALEFRHVVSTLQQDAAAHELSAFDSAASPYSAVSPYAGGHYHSARPRSRSQSRSRTPRANEHETDPFDAAMGVQLNERALRLTSSTTTLGGHSDYISPTSPDDRASLSPEDYTRSEDHIPSVGGSDVMDDTESQVSYIPPSKRQKAWHVFRRTLHILFPSLHNIRDKTILSFIASLFAAPAIMALTVTLPVVVTPYENPSTAREKLQDDENERLIEFEEEGEARSLLAEEENDRNEMVFNKWLFATQCALGPLFCAMVLTAANPYHLWIMLATAISGVALGILVLIFAKNGTHPVSIMARCFMGFIVAVVWIMAIADEVVQVLQTFGFVFGLSDAIIGLTVFAVGNSLADLVANMSVAMFAPMMGFAACFGGPMLNILFGIGGSTLYILLHRHTSHYSLEFTTTLWVSTIGLLSLLVTTIIIVPWNGYFLTRSWGIFLVCFYLSIMTVNLVVELKT